MAVYSRLRMPMRSGNAQKIGAEIGLVACALFWGGAFVVMKNALDVWPIAALLCVRFVLAGLLMLPFVRRGLRLLGREAVLGALAAGALVFFAYYTQTIGLSMTSAGNNAFITAFYVVLVPLLQWGVRKKYPGLHSIAAAVLCLAGVGLIAVQSRVAIGTGDLWTLLCGVLYGAHVVLVSHYTDKGVPIMAYTALQFLFAGAFGGLVWLLSEPAPDWGTLLRADVVIAMLYLVLPATIFALAMQNVSLKFAPPGHAALLMSLEAPFGCLFGVLFLDEQLTPRFLAGAALILGAILLSELFHGKKRKPS